MSKKNKSKYGIKYYLDKLNDKYYSLIPLELVKGTEEEDRFITEDGRRFHYCQNASDLRCKYVIDTIRTEEELEIEFDCDNNEEDDLGNLFFEIYEHIGLLIDKDQVKNTGYVSKYVFNLSRTCSDDKNVILNMDKGVPQCILDQNALNEILSAKKVKEKNALLRKYQQYLSSIKKLYENKNITRISVVNNKVEYYDVDGKVNITDVKVPEIMKRTNQEIDESDISYDGLRKYIKERIFGHDEAIDNLSQILYMNYTALPGEGVDSALLVGPTGTGKTETIKVASEYLGIPMYDINASNLVSQGIKGTSIENVIVGLYEACGRNLQKAERGIVFLDEYDKLNDSTLETKTDLKNILLTFNAGGNFPVETDHYSFTYNSSMTNRMYAGVFDRITKVKNPIGFETKPTNNTLGDGESIRKQIIEHKYFTLEELSRISTIIGYNDLSIETKKDILENSKLSIIKIKHDRYLRQFGIKLVVLNEFYDALFEQLPKTSTGMRSVNNLVSSILCEIEKFILEGCAKGYKEIVLTRKLAENSRDRNSYTLK